jgi:hypothetical protein
MTTKNLFILNLLLIKKRIGAYLKIFFFVYVFFLLTSCQHDHDKARQSELSFSSQNQLFLEDFFHELFVDQEPALFTLFGSKPVTELYLCHYTEEELLYFQKHLPLEMKKLTETTSYDPIKFTKDWNTWMKKKSSFHIKNYLFGQCKSPYSSKDEIGLFVNIKETYLTLSKHYDTFRSLLGYDFNPMEIILQLEKPQHPFWDDVLKNHVLNGILLGFGEKNAWNFYKEMNGVKRNSTMSAEQSLGKHLSIEEIPIPYFRSYETSDPKILEYQKEKKKILEIYKNKDFFLITLQKLTNANEQVSSKNNITMRKTKS